MSKNAHAALHNRLIRQGIYMVTSVQNDVIEEIVKWILTNRPQKRKFTLLINSSGGSGSAPLRFASFVRTLEKNVKITGVAFDTCGSAALALLQCCHERHAVQYSGFFIHHFQTSIKASCQDFDPKKIKLEFEEDQRIENELVKLQCERSGMLRKKWMSLADRGEADRDTPLFAEEILELGLIDKILPNFPCF